MRPVSKHWLKLAVILFYFTAVYLLLRVYNIDYAKLKEADPYLIREKVRAWGVWVPVLYVAFYALRPLILFPATILSILGGVIFGYLWGIVLVLIGAMLSASAEFLISRSFGRKLVIGLIGDSNLLRIGKAVRDHSFRTVLLIRLIPNVAFDIQNFSLGLCGIKFSVYFFATLLGIIPITFVYVYLGYSFFDWRYLWKLGLAFALLISIYFIQKYFRKIYFKKS